MQYGLITFIVLAYSRARYMSSNFCPSVNPSTSVTINFSVLMKAKIMKPCIVIVLDMFYKHAPWPCTHDEHSALLWLCKILRRDVEQNTKVCFSVLMVTRMMKPCIVIILDLLSMHTPWPSTFDLHFTLHWLCPNFSSWRQVKYMYKSVFLSVLMAARMMKPYIVIVLELLSEHAPWPSTLDLHVRLHWLYQNFTSSKILECVSLY